MGVFWCWYPLINFFMTVCDICVRMPVIPEFKKQEHHHKLEACLINTGSSSQNKIHSDAFF